MTDNVENLVLEHLRAIRSALSEHGDRLNRIELRLSAIEQTLGSLYAQGFKGGLYKSIGYNAILCVAPKISIE